MTGLSMRGDREKPAADGAGWDRPLLQDRGGLVNPGRFPGCPFHTRKRDFGVNTS